MMIRNSVLLVSIVTSLAAPGLSAQEATSQASVRALVTLLDRAKLDSFAVKVDGEPDLYVSVLHVPNAQLLVVSGRSPAPAALDARIAAREYRTAYGDHNASTLREGKLFVMDMEANGLADRSREGQPFDIAYENGVTTTMFNGDWRNQNLSEREYRDRFTTIDKRYVEMLARLIAGLERLGTP
jgi:hypothetical protein